MRVLISGGSGLIGGVLAESLRSRGDEVWILTREERDEEGWIHWNTSKGIVPLRTAEGMDAIVHLVGAPLAARAWTPRRRALLRESRIRSTEVIGASLARLDAPPRHWVGVGTLGLFGHRGASWIDDDDAPGEGFLADLGREWEEVQHSAAREVGARSAVLRMGVVLSARGGVVPPLLTPFRYGFGGWLGDGEQYTPWLAMDDAVGALTHLLDHEGCEGGFNGNVPEPVVLREWCEAFGQAVGKKVRGPAPTWAVRGALGELADALILSSLRARPRKLLESGYRFSQPELLPLLREIVAERGS